MDDRDPSRFGRRRAAATLVLVAMLSACVAPAESATSDPSRDLVEAPAVVTEAPAASAQMTSLLAEMASRGELESIRLIGDSITAGVGCDGAEAYTDAVIYQGGEGTFYETAESVSCWANDFRAWADEAGVSSFVNAGIPGARMAWLADEPAAWLGEGADVIVVMLGTNDAVWSDADEFEEDARAALAAAADACDLLVVVSPPTNARTDGRAQIGMDEIDRILARVSDERGYEHVSLLDAVAPDDGTLNDDLIHPTSAGSHAMWEMFRAKLSLDERP